MAKETKKKEGQSTARILQEIVRIVDDNTYRLDKETFLEKSQI